MTRGRPFQPGNKFGHGRPPGSRNKRTVLAEKLFEDNSAALMGMALVKAREDPQMLKMLVSRIPRRRHAPIKLGSLPLDTAEDLDRASKRILKKASSGQIGWGEALEISAVIEARRHVLETRDLERRVGALENRGQAA
jgi:hypothetical protein